MPEYSIGRYRGELALIYRDTTGKRHRHTLNTTSQSEAEHRAPAVYAELTKPQGSTVADLWTAYVANMAGRAVVTTMGYTWRALMDRFGPLDATTITITDCDAHTAQRRAAGIKDGTIHTELGHLRMVLLWAVKHRLIPMAPHIERPGKPKSTTKHMTRDQVRSVLTAAKFHHARLAGILLYTTAARVSALLGLTWDRCDFDTGLIDLRDPLITRPHKGRALVPMNGMSRKALLEAKQVAMSDYCIEWAGKRVGSVKRAIPSMGEAAGLPFKVTPHVFRHSAAVHMAEDGRSMETIAQFLGHSNTKITREVYARFSPDYLREEASSLNIEGI